MARFALLLSLVAVGLAAVALLGSLSPDPPDLAAPPAPRDDSMADEARDRAIETLAREINKLRRERAADAAAGAPAAIAPTAAEPAAAAPPAEDVSELAPEVLLRRLRAVTGKGAEPDRAVRLADEKDHRTAAEWMDQAASQSDATNCIRLDARVRAAQFLLQDGDRAGARERMAPVIEDFRDAVPPGLEVPVTQARNLWRQLGE